MGIRKTHEHPEKGGACYRTRTHHPLKNSQIINMNAKEYAVAYMPYTGHWYVYDTETGREVATLTREFYNDLMALLPWWQKGDLAPAPDCVP